LRKSGKEKKKDMKIERRDNKEEREWPKECPTLLYKFLATLTMTGLVSLT